MYWYLMYETNPSNAPYNTNKNIVLVIDTPTTACSKITINARNKITMYTAFEIDKLTMLLGLLDKSSIYPLNPE